MVSFITGILGEKEEKIKNKKKKNIPEA